MSKEEDPHTKKAREDINYRNAVATKAFNESTRKLVREQNKKIEDLEKLIKQQSASYLQLREEFNNFRQQIIGTGTTE
jgi:molecular chaperone GrpE (heat shock protein)